MFCRWYKWQLSRAANRKRPAAGPVERHLSRCPDCREYAAFIRSLEQRMAEDRSAYLEGFPSFTPDKIAGLRSRYLPTPAAAPKKARLLAKPAFAATAAMVLVAAGLFLLKLPPFRESASLEQLSSPNFPQISLTQIASKMESPLETEFQALKNTVKSSAEFLISRLNISLGGENLQ